MNRSKRPGVCQVCAGLLGLLAVLSLSGRAGAAEDQKIMTPPPVGQPPPPAAPGAGASLLQSDDVAYRLFPEWSPVSDYFWTNWDRGASEMGTPAGEKLGHPEGLYSGMLLRPYDALPGGYLVEDPALPGPPRPPLTTPSWIQLAF